MSTSAVSSSAAQAAARRSDDKTLAATAANYVIHAQKIGPRETRDEDHKSHVPQKDISPAQEVLASAGAAASLAPSHRTESEPHRTWPQKEPATSKGENRLSAASSRAAFLAVREHGIVAETPEESAGPAPGSEQAGRDEYLEDDPTAKAAATNAITGRRRSKTAETPSVGADGYPELAQEAATISHKTTREEEPPKVVVSGGDRDLDSAKMHGVAVARSQRDLYTAHPSVGIDAEEKAKEETRHAAAVSMAQQMYAVLPRAEELAAAEGSSVHSDRPARREAAEVQKAPSDSSQQAVYLHTIAERRVADRMAKMDEERAAQERYRIPSRTPSRPRSSNSSRVRRWSSSEGDAGSMARMRSQRRPFQPRPVAEEEEEEDGVVDEALMAMAKRNTASIIEGVDKQIYVYSGKPSQAKLDEWERRAREHRRSTGGRGTATSFVTAREDGENLGPDQEDPEELAKRRLKPTMNEIDDRVNERRGRALAKRLDENQEKRALQEQKTRDTSTAKVEKQVEKMAKKETKARKKQQKQKQTKEEKDAEKARKKADKEDQKAKKQAKKKEKKGKKQEVNSNQPDEPGEGGGPAGATGGASTREPGEQNSKQKGKESKSGKGRSSQEENTPSSARNVATAEQPENEPAPSTEEPARKDKSQSDKHQETQPPHKKKSSESARDTSSRGAMGAGPASANEATTTKDTNDQRLEREGSRTGRKRSSTDDPGARHSENGQARQQNEGEQQELGYAMRQWSTSPAGRRVKKHKDKTTTTTTRKERRFFGAFFGGRPRDTSGKQGSFDSEPHSPRIAERNGNNIAQTEPLGPAEPPRRPGKFQEEI